jgi:UDP-N-acetylglucosamine 2-epimerase (non-hydrolysing)
MEKLIDIIAGARPNFMKVAPIIRELRRRISEGGFLRYRLVHTGQHYDAAMSGTFFDQLGIPEPDVNLGTGSGTPARQTGAIMVGYEQVLMDRRSNLCLVVGDVTSTMACAITAQKQHVPVAHVEAGIRSGDWSMPEEINRMVTDAITNYFFTTSEYANDTLRNTGIAANRIFFVGNTMIDTLVANLERLQRPEWWNAGSRLNHGYLLLTLHRPSNVDDPDQLSCLLKAIAAVAGGTPIVFPVHPRTLRTLDTLPAVPELVMPVGPQPYLQFIYLLKHARGVITDSGGITEEATYLGIPCMTLRTTTERPETVSVGTNELLGTDSSAIQHALTRLLAGQWKAGSIPPLWDGKTSTRIVAVLEKLLHD